MALTGRPVTQKEMTFAYYFLKRLGGNMDNSLLITAVVAWLRSEVGYNLGSMHNLNNPLNIRHSPFQSGSRKTTSNGSFALFPTLKAGAYASADMLTNAGHDWRGYWMVVAAAKRSTKDAAAANEQALDFLEAIALSKWDAGHYGLAKSERTLATYVAQHNNLALNWSTIGGHLPAIKIEPDAPPPSQAKPPSTPPKSLNPPNATAAYVDPFEAQGFYMASRPKSDLGNLPPQ